MRGGWAKWKTGQKPVEGGLACSLGLPCLQPAFNLFDLFIISIYLTKINTCPACNLPLYLRIIFIHLNKIFRGWLALA